MKILIRVLPIVLGFLLDQRLGDPHHWPHPIRWIGTLIMWLEEQLRRCLRQHEKVAGSILVLTVLIVATLLPASLLFIGYRINIGLGIAIESVLCYYLLAARALKDESMKVYEALEKEELEEARQAVSMIVGRDTDCLSETGIIKAAVETVAENTSDGVTAPLFYMLLGGAPLGFFYKAANTMDSMIGYKNDRYLQFGRLAAKLDDVLNYIPARLTAFLMIIAAYLCGLDGNKAYKIWKRDRYHHASPNSAQTEAVCAGALHIQLAGDAYYFGKLCKKQTIGDHERLVECADIKRANRLMLVTALLMLVIGSLITALVIAIT